MSDRLAISRLEAATAWLRQSPVPAARAFGQAVEDWWAGESEQGLEQLLGFSLPGQRTMATDRRYSARDAVLRKAARQHCAGMSALASGDFLAAKLAQYRGSAWDNGEREAQECPRPAQTLEACLWEALRYVDAPLSGDRIRKILGTS